MNYLKTIDNYDITIDINILINQYENNKITTGQIIYEDCSNT
jgi:hypothetical protein